LKKIGEDVFAAAKMGRGLTETRGARRGKEVVKWREGAVVNVE
jgi:hypothetical protein